MRPATEGSLAALFDALPPASLRESVLIIVSTRPINLLEEAEHSARLSGGAARGLLGRVILLDASRGDLADMIEFAESPSATALEWYESHLWLLGDGPRSDRAGAVTPPVSDAPEQVRADALRSTAPRGNGETGP
jgi:hypothetical protein